jgi:outer membrane protein assembly factor BamB
VGVLGLVAVIAGVVVALSGGGGDGDAPGAGGRGDSDGGWVAEGRGHSQLLAVGGGLVCSTATGSAFCVDAGSGADRFEVELHRGLATSPVLLDDRMLVASSGAITGDLVACSLDGAELWDESLAIDAEQEMPVVGGVVTAIEGDELVGVAVADGREVWRAYVPTDERDREPDDPIGPQAVGPDVYSDGTRVYAATQTIDPTTGTASGNIVAVDPATGRAVWRSAALGDIGFGNGIAAAAPFDDGSAVAFLMEGTPRRVLALAVADGRQLWEAPIASPYADIVDAGGRTVVADGPDMRALGRDGRAAWEVPAPVIARSPDLLGPGELVVDQGRLFVAGVDVVEVDPATGESELLLPDVDATDVAIAADLLVVAGISELRAIPLPAPPGG